VFSVGVVRERRAAADTARTRLSGNAPLGPCAFLGIRFTKNGRQCRIGVGSAHDDVDPRRERHQRREIAVARIAVAEAPGSATREISEPDIRKTDPGECVEQIQLLEAGKVALDDAVRQRAVLSPLNVDRHLPAIVPIGVEQSAVPEGPNVGRRARGIVADPKDLFVGWDGKWNPRPVDVVSPEEMVGNDRPSRVDDRNHPFEWEPLVALDV